VTCCGTEYDDIEIIVLNDDEVRVMIDNALAKGGCPGSC